MTKTEKAIKLCEKVHANPEPIVTGLYLVAACGATITIGSLSMAAILKHRS